MKQIKICFIATCLLISAGAFAKENNNTNTDKGSFGISVNPAFYALGGYSVKGLYHLPKRWSFALAVEAGFELPDDFRDAFFKDNESIDVNWDYLVGVEARYRFNDASYDKGFFAYATLGMEGWTVDEIDTSNEDSFDNWYSSIGIGYNWYPFKKKNFNIGLAYNVIFILNNTDDRLVGSTTYAIDIVIPPSLIPSTISIGWRF